MTGIPCCPADSLVVYDRETVGIQEEFVYIAPYTQRPVFHVEFPARDRCPFRLLYRFFKRVLCHSLGQELVLQPLVINTSFDHR
jgi:hypothetical protein